MSQTVSITPDNGGRIILKSIRHQFLNAPVTVTDWSDVDRDQREVMFEPRGRSVPIAITDVPSSPTFELEIATPTAVEARNMDLRLAAGGTYLVQTPPDCPVPGGYVRLGNSSQARRTRSARSPRRYFRLACRVVAPDGPDVIGGSMTYAALLNLYGGYDNVLAANPSYAALLALMASPDDVVVI
jgi:hypothetical protein